MSKKNKNSFNDKLIKIVNGLEAILYDKSSNEVYEKYRTFDNIKTSLIILILEMVVAILLRKYFYDMPPIKFGVLAASIIFGLYALYTHYDKIKIEENKVINIIFSVLHIILMMYNIFSAIIIK